jgi:hypothetical protein
MLERQQRSAAASALRRFLSTPEAMQLMRSPAAGVRDHLELIPRQLSKRLFGGCGTSRLGGSCG